MVAIIWRRLPVYLTARQALSPEFPGRPRIRPNPLGLEDDQ